jgi:GT2 family glycosyltransferase
MNPGDPGNLERPLAEKLVELERERRRLDELTESYRIVERSKFALLQSIALNMRAVIRGGVVPRKPLFRGRGFSSGSTESAAALAPAARMADTIRLLIDELTWTAAGRLDAVEALKAAREGRDHDDAYGRWRSLYGLRDSELQRMRETLPFLPRQPLVSVIMATYETPERYLKAAIESVRDQVYPNWELCIADDASTLPHVRRVLEEYARLDPRIKLVFRPQNGHISRASNSALEVATGEFVGFLDHDDLLSPDALFECVMIANRVPDVDMIYSDEDKIDDDDEFSDEFFKPEWSPDTFLSRMYTCHFGFYRRTLVEEIGGLRPDFDGSQDYDLVLRITERTPRIHHIPKVLYHWRIHPQSAAADEYVKPYAAHAAERAIAEAIARRGEPGRAFVNPDAPGTYSVRYDLRDRRKISIIVPTRNHGDDVDRCLTSIFEAPGYENFEVLLLDNGSDERASLRIFEAWAARESRVRVVRHDVPFNFSAINNYAVEQCDGHYLLFLNNDTQILCSDWLLAMVEQAQRPSVGAVGALLLYPDNTVQHAGVVIGLGGVAGHSHKHFSGDAPGYHFTLRAINNVSAVTAACMMVRRSVFHEVGGFDEQLAVAFNDVDFCLKVRAAGYRNLYLPHVKLMHFESKSRGYDTTPDKQDRFDREVAMMRRRWKTDTDIDPYYSPNLTRDYENFALKS